MNIIFFNSFQSGCYNSVIAWLFFFDCIFGWFLGFASHINDLSWLTKLKCFREVKNGSGVSHISVSMAFEEGEKGHPINHKSCSLFHATPVQQICPFIFFTISGLSLCTSSSSHSACETKLTACSTAGKWMCTKPSVARGEQQERRGKTAWIPILLLVTPNLHSLPVLPSWWIYKWIEKVLFQTCVGMLFARG